MGRPAIILALLLLPATAWGQHEVRLRPEDVTRYSLPESVDSTYMIYTFSEYRFLRLNLTELEGIKKKLGLTEKKVVVLETQVKASDKRAETLKQDLDGCLASRKRVTKKWSDCDLNYRMCQAGSWKPWVVTAVSLAVGVVGAILGGYYGWKYSKVK